MQRCVPSHLHAPTAGLPSCPTAQEELERDKQGWAEVVGAGNALLRRRRRKGTMPAEVAVIAQPGDGLAGHNKAAQGRFIVSVGALEGRKHFPR